MTSPRGRTKETEALRWHTREPRPTWQAAGGIKRLVEAFLTAVVILAIGVALAMATSFIIATGRPRPAVDTATTRSRRIAARGPVRRRRRHRGDPEGRGRQGPGHVRRRRRHQLQLGRESSRPVRRHRRHATRSRRPRAAKAQAMSGVAADTSYNAAEKARSGAFSGTTIDPSTLRSHATWGPRTAPVSMAPTARGPDGCPALFPCPGRPEAQRQRAVALTSAENGLSPTLFSAVMR